MTYADPSDSAADMDDDDGWLRALCLDCWELVSTVPHEEGSCGVVVDEIVDCPRGDMADGADDAIWRKNIGANSGP